MFKNILPVMTMLFHGGTKHNDVINVAFGTIQACKNLIHHLLKFYKCIFNLKDSNFH
jgi:hypothetical protein